jgi:hypothetical protein
MAKAKPKKKVRGARRPVRDLGAKTTTRVKGGNTASPTLPHASASGKHFDDVTL